jgi:hypothetical protein
MHESHFPPAVIAVPMSIGVVLVFGMGFFFWRKIHPKSFHKVLDSVPFCGCFGKWRKTREKNKQIRRMRDMGILTGDNRRDGGSVLAAPDTYARHLKKFEDDAARAWEKKSLETPNRRQPVSPYTPVRKGRRDTDTTALPSLASPWKSIKAKVSSDGSPIATPPKFSKNTSNEDTVSLESWEEKWYAMGEKSETAGPSRTTPSITKDLHGMQRVDGSEDKTAPGESWRKLV